MAVDTLFDLSVSYAIATGTAAGILSVFSWEIFRRSPLGRAIFVLSASLSMFVLYHVLLLGFQSDPTFLRVIESAAYTFVAAFVGVMVLSQRRLRKNAKERGV